MRVYKDEKGLGQDENDETREVIYGSDYFRKRWKPVPLPHGVLYARKGGFKSFSKKARMEIRNIAATTTDPLKKALYMKLVNSRALTLDEAVWFTVREIAGEESNGRIGDLGLFQFKAPGAKKPALEPATMVPAVKPEPVYEEEVIFKPEVEEKKPFPWWLVAVGGSVAALTVVLVIKKRKK